SAGTLPAGLSLSTAGVLSGTPTAAGTYNFTVQVTGGTTATKAFAVTIATSAPTLTGLSIAGPSSVNESSSGTYAATATWSDNSTTTVTPTWGVGPTLYASITASGVLNTLAVPSNQFVTVSASYTSGGVNRSATQSVTIVNVPPALTGLSIAGPSSVNESSSGTYAATATWSDNSTTTVTPTWSVSPSTYASLSSSGVLTTLAVPSNQSATVTASYTSGGVTRTATQAVTIVNVPPVPAAPTNMNLSGPVQTTPVALFRLGWDPVTMYTDGTPIGTVSVTYNAYWTTDETLSVGTLRNLATSIPGTSVTFDPIAAGMVQNQRVYFTSRTVLATGEQSSLSEGLTWVAINEGPVAPSNPAIMKR
ncbi:MAG TPA: putative Ig domain-containing protein, partial [Candidatus Deferrimicrobiaceae bacterium]